MNNEILIKETIKEFQKQFGTEKADRIWKQCHHNAERNFYNKMVYRLEKAKKEKGI